MIYNLLASIHERKPKEIEKQWLEELYMMMNWASVTDTD
jgi:hypothetical protein